MKQTVMFSKHIHSTSASCSSNDEWLKFFTTKEELDFCPIKGRRITSKKFPFLNGETIEEVTGDKLFKGIYFTSDKTFYNKGLHSGRGFLSDGYHNTDGFKALIQSYISKGWLIEDSGRNEAQKAYDKREEKRGEKKSKKAGLVLWMSYDNKKKAPLTVYQGGFSDEVFNSPLLQEYISHGGVFGWIGDSGARRPEHDRIIEEGLRERGLSVNAMYNWISSSDGRHFADALCGMPLDEQIEEIKKNLNRIFNLCLIYGSSQHEGSLKSTIEIRNDYQNQGILLPEDEQGYDPAGWMKLMTVAMAGMTGNVPPELKEMLPGLIEDIKAGPMKRKPN